ncbi:tetratricopeptide repeat protein [Tamlana crocina]|uniref:Tetratricopeptide repeat protein n=1 Tax=Tamlana crocina TaxID=393006 RepID=A0ABX1DE12_9FLAO|nr:tetratricopeptide repeat protein [Tamlana crocina]NJX15607.1 tetratricopeptide repeat protein [Tamlana crocina]
MKKGILLALAVSMGAFSFAQKKELKTAEKAIKSNNFAEAKGALSAAKSLMSEMDEKLKAKYYFLNAQALYANGKGSDADVNASLESLAKVQGDYQSEVAEFKQNMVNNMIKVGNEAYEAQDFSKASKYFEKSYRASTKDTMFLYYAAATAVNVKEYDRALSLYEELKDLGYTGINTEYFATNVETGEEEVLDKSTRDLYVKAKSHVKPGERKTESKKPEIVKNIALIYVSEGKDDEALAAFEEARKENPEDINLILSEANIHFKLGNNDKFTELLEKATQMDPQNPELQYNLGVVSAESGQPEAARAYYEKAIALDPNYVNAYINLAALILGEEKPIIEEMNGLGTSSADNKRYDELREKRQSLYKDAIPFLSKALEIDSDNLNAAKTLMNIYSILGETDKRNELKAKVEAIESGN